jgi:hypothetical protein
MSGFSYLTPLNWTETRAYMRVFRLSFARLAACLQRRDGVHRKYRRSSAFIGGHIVFGDFCQQEDGPPMNADERR